MFTHNLHLAFRALLLLAAINLMLAANERHDMSVITDFIDVMEKQIEIMECMSRSCDPLVYEKMMQIENDVEREIKLKPKFSETHEYESEKADNVIQLSVAKFIEIEPECQDTKYSCPNPVLKNVPKYLTDYIDAIQNVVTYGRKCVNMNNIVEAINILGESVEYVEEYQTHAGNYLQRVLPSCIHCSNGFKQLCNEAAKS